VIFNREDKACTMRYFSISSLWYIAPALLLIPNRAYAQTTDGPPTPTFASGCPTDNAASVSAYEICYASLISSLLACTDTSCTTVCDDVIVTQGGRCFSSFCPRQATAWAGYATSICNYFTETDQFDTATDSTTGAPSSATETTGSSQTSSPGSSTTRAVQTTTAAGTQTAAATTTGTTSTAGAGRIDSAVGIGGAVVGIVGALALML